LTGRALSIGIAALTIALVACGGASEDGTASPPASDASATVSATESTLATATLDADSEATAIATEETGATSVAAEDCAPTTSGLPSNGVTALVVNNDCLEPLFFAFDENGGDPFWHIHTQQDDTFISLELYTAYGPSWTGETGAFPLDCNVPWGLCLLFDPDGAGPEPVLMWGNGEITIDRLDEGGYDVTFGGTMPATADGTIYEITSTRWSSS
jgi:hypothetical protein